jgi:hypothetical protein
VERVGGEGGRGIGRRDRKGEGEEMEVGAGWNDKGGGKGRES